MFFCVIYLDAINKNDNEKKQRTYTVKLKRYSIYLQ